MNKIYEIYLFGHVISFSIAKTDHFDRTYATINVYDKGTMTTFFRPMNEKGMMLVAYHGEKLCLGIFKALNLNDNYFIELTKKIKEIQNKKEPFAIARVIDEAEIFKSSDLKPEDPRAYQ